MTNTLAVKRLLLSLSLVLAITSGVAAEPRFSVQKDVPVPMTDGVVLRADVYLPSGTPPFPTVLLRTPYDKRGKAFFAEAVADRGYAVVAQDVRGMNASQGRFIPFVHERADGLDTLTWIARQDWCNGSIGMWGPSYVGYCALIVAAEGHPNLKAVVNISGFSDASAMVMPGGALHLMLALPWTLSGQIHGKGSLQDYDWPKAFRHLPVRDMPAAMGVESAVWQGMMEMFASGGLEQRATASDRLGSVRIPVLHTTGWYDFVARYTLDAYESITDSPRDAADGGGPQQRLIVGPWRHDQIWLNHARVGDVDFGKDAVMGVPRIVDLSARWFDQHLRRSDAGWGREKPVRLFVMGENQWREFDRWPPPAAHERKWYFHSGSAANGARGDGTLSPTPPAAAGRDTFTYDPMDPVPTRGGVNMHFFTDNLGIRDQREIEERQDVLVYSSDPFDEAVDIIGPLTAVVYASTTGRHADITAKLVDVREDGYAAIIEDGIRRGPDPVNGRRVDLMEPDKVYLFTVDLGATGARIAKGHRLRVEISSSNFPKFNRNPGNGDDPLTASTLTRTSQTVYHTPDFPSHVILPVLE